MANPKFKSLDKIIMYQGKAKGFYIVMSYIKKTDTYLLKIPRTNNHTYLTRTDVDANFKLAGQREIEDHF